MKWAFLLLLVATVALAALFILLPGIDLAVERAYLRDDLYFPLHGVAWAVTVNRMIPWLLGGLAVLTGACGLAAVCRHPVRGVGLREVSYVAAVFLLGPGLLTNVLLKDHLGRARPSQVLYDDSTFTPPFVPSTACDHNCSFPAGVPAAGFAFVAIALAAPRRYRAVGIVAAVAFGCFLGAVRMLQGGHYFSDVLFAGLLMALVATGLHILWFRDSSRRPDTKKAPSARTARFVD